MTIASFPKGHRVNAAFDVTPNEPGHHPDRKGAARGLPARLPGPWAAEGDERGRAGSPRSDGGASRDRPATRSGRTRRFWLAAGAAGLAAGPALAAAAPVVTILGDSITAGYGLPAAAALPARLEAALARLGVPARVRGAGVSGDTSADGLARADFSVQGDTTLCLVALGGNDLLQGLDPKATRANLEAIVTRLKARRIPVVLAGLTAPRAIGASYARDFDAVFPAVARKEGATLYPDLLAGVSGNSALIQADGLHPNARGVEVIVGRLAPVIAGALKRRR
jgi:acyl-CoA thioesterase-1